MARAGRKRKVDADRYPNGAVKPEEHPSPCVTKRLILASMAGMADPQWGTVAGRYFLTGALNSTQYEAAKRYGMVCEAYTGLILGPRPPKTSTGERGIVGSKIDPDTEMGEREAEHHIKARQRYDQTKSVMVGYSIEIERDLQRFCVGIGIVPDYDKFQEIKKILTKLAEFWKIDVR